MNSSTSGPYNHATHHHSQCHGLSCEDFDALLDRAEQRCELCGIDPAPIVWPTRVTTGLLIDHDQLTGAVRGLVCSKCNAHLRRVDSGERETDDRTAHYLALARQGVCR